jgi:hypothetical protein
MAELRDLETPQSSEDLYLAYGEDVEVFDNRPAFTGDVFALSPDRSVALVQHPCAMRRGLELAPKLLTCEIKLNRGGMPSDWASGHFKRMFLPQLAGDSFTIEFEDIDVLARVELEGAKRLAILSSRGVNLLMQRWLFHNARVVVPTITINAQTSGPFEEADLIQEACDDLVGGGKTVDESLLLVDAWLGDIAAEGSPSRRDMLADSQQRSVIRSTLRKQIKDWLA